MTTHPLSLSGVPTEIRFIGGAQQAIITKNKSVPMSEKLYDLAKSLTIRVGDFVLADHSEKEVNAFFQKMLACHVKQILTEARQFTYEGEPIVFKCEGYKEETNEDGSKRKVKMSEEIEVPVPDGFPVKPVRVFDASKLQDITTMSQLREAMKNSQWEVLEVDSYDKVIENSLMEFTLPKSKYRIQIQMRNGMSGQVVGAIDTEDLDSNAGILSFLPKFKKEEGTTWINFTKSEADKAHGLDLAFMRYVVDTFEGQVDTELEFKVPWEKSKMEYTDLLHQPSFFFLSVGA